MLRHLRVAVLIAFVFATLAACSGDDDGDAPRPGDLDRQFGNGGIVITPFPAHAFLNGLGLAPNGDVIAAGSTQTPEAGPVHSALARYRPNGSPDIAFGDGGRVVTPVGQISEIDDVGVQSAGGIIAAGVSLAASDVTQIIDARFLLNGRLDATFGENGIVATASTPDVVLATRDLVLTANDTILVAGVYTAPDADGITVARYLPNGVPDPSFGTDGLTLVQLPADTIDVAMTLQADGGLLVAAPLVIEPLGFRLAFVRLLANGTPDPTYGDRGRIVLDQTRFPRLLGFQPDGSLLTVETTDDQVFQLVRHRPDGTRDDGYRPQPLADPPTAATADADGNLVLTLTAGDGLRVLRLTSAGDPDPTFGAGGGVTTVPPGGGVPTRLLLQPNGRLLVGGITNDDPSRFLLLRYVD